MKTGYVSIPFRSADEKQNYVIVSNHTCTVDPFMMAIAFEFPVYFVASDEIFSIPFFSPIISYLAAPIPKTKGMSDYGTVKTMMQVAKEGGSIALFPEGDRTFDGTLQYIDPSIARLFKLLKLPILIMNYEGSYGIDPRFCRRYRRGKSVGYISTLIPYSDYKNMEDGELYNLVISRMNLSVSAYRYVTDLRYKNSRLAEYLERVLYICPDCKSISTLHSRVNRFFCAACGYTVEYLENITFKPITGNTFFLTVHEWNTFQYDEMKKRDFLPRETIFEDKEIELYEKTRSKPRSFVNKGIIHLYTDKLVIYGKKNNTVFALEQIVSIVAIGKRKLMIYTAQKSFLLQGKKTLCALKYVQYFTILQEKMQ